MDRNWLDIQHRGFSAYLEETAVAVRIGILVHKKGGEWS